MSYDLLDQYKDANDYLLKLVEELKKENERLRKINKKRNMKIYRLERGSNNEQKSTKQTTR